MREQNAGVPSLAEVVGRRIRDLRERRGWSQSELARRAGIGISTLSEIESGQSAPRLDTLVALAQALGAPLESFLRAEPNPLEARLRAVENPENLHALQQWLERCRRYLEVEALLLKRKPSAPLYSLKPTRNPKDELEQIEAIAGQERRRLHIGAEPIEDPVAVIEEAGLRVVGADLPENDIDGAFIAVPECEASVALINRSKPPLRQRFTLAHEYGHFLLHRDSEVIFDYTMFNASSPAERQANAFAAAFLMPRELIERIYDEYGFSRRRGQLPIYGWLLMVRRLRVSAQTLAWRLYNLGYISEAERDWMLHEGDHLLKEMERAFYDEPVAPPRVPTLSDRTRALILHAYGTEQMTASAATNALERTLTAVQEYLTAARMPAERAKEFFERIRMVAHGSKNPAEAVGGQ